MPDLSRDNLKTIVTFLETLTDEYGAASVQINNSGNFILRIDCSQTEYLTLDEFFNKVQT